MTFKNCPACELPRCCQGVRRCAKSHRPRDPNSMRSRVEADIRDNGPSTADQVAARIGCTREDAGRALRSLRRDGHLQITQPGAWRGRKGREPSVYAIAAPTKPAAPKPMLTSVFDLAAFAARGLA